MRRLPMLAVLVLTVACGEGDGAGAASAPIAAPMAARERLLHDLRQQNHLAEQRRAAMEEVIENGENGESGESEMPETGR